MAIIEHLICPVGEIARRSGAITSEEQTIAMKVQQRAIALQTAIGLEAAKLYFATPSGLVALKDDESWAEMKTKLAGLGQPVTADHEAAAQARMDAGLGATEGVPPMGRIVTALGMVQREPTEAILAAQAGARVIHMSDQALRGDKLSDAPAARADDTEFLKNAQEMAKRAHWQALGVWTLTNTLNDMNSGNVSLSEAEKFKREATHLAQIYAHDFFPRAKKVLWDTANRLYVEALRTGKRGLSQLAGAIQQDSVTGRGADAPVRAPLGQLAAPARLAPAPAKSQPKAPAPPRALQWRGPSR